MENVTVERVNCTQVIAQGIKGQFDRPTGRWRSSVKRKPVEANKGMRFREKKTAEGQHLEESKMAGG